MILTTAKDIILQFSKKKRAQEEEIQYTDALATVIDVATTLAIKERTSEEQEQYRLALIAGTAAIFAKKQIESNLSDTLTE